MAVPGQTRLAVMDVVTVAGSLAAFTYVGALWYAAPLFFKEPPQIADRLRAVAIIGIAVPGSLALLHLLYPSLLWVSVAALTLCRIFRRPLRFQVDTWLYATLAATVLICWAPLVRPLLDGDTLLYHLPNAIAFVQDHSIWTGRAPYWVYPPASELFAAGLFAASGRWSLPLAGIVPALLITARIYSVARDGGAAQYSAASVALAFICMPVAALQVGTLQNDLWLAAFFIEVVSAADRSHWSFAVCAFLKPFGWVEAVLAALVARVPWRSALLGLVPLAIWLIRDYIVYMGGAPLGFVTRPYLPSTIAGNVGIALPQLVHGIATHSPQSFLWVALLIAGIFAGPRRYVLAGTAAIVIYAFLPLAYSDGTNNFVTNASSLRFALPALACGALVAATLLRHAPLAGAVVGYIFAAWGAWSVLDIFWNDADTHRAILATVLAIAAALAVRPTRGFSLAAAMFAIVLVARVDSSSRATNFYGDWMRDAIGKATGAYSWISAHQPRLIVAENVRIGSVLMVSPSTRVIDALVSDGCAVSRRHDALLFVGSNEGLSGAQLATAIDNARACGVVVYRDAAAIIVRPRT